MAGQLTVKRKAYVRKAHTRKGYWKVVRGKRVYIKPTKVKATRVPATTYKIKDVGAPGRGPKLIEIKRKDILKKAGYSIYKPAEERHKALRKVDKQVGSIALFRMLQAQVILRKRIQQPKQRAIFEADRNWVEKNLLSKREALLMTAKPRKKWKSMSPLERAKSMPGGKI